MKKLILATALLSTLTSIGMEEKHVDFHVAMRLGAEIATLKKHINKKNRNLAQLAAHEKHLISLRNKIAKEIPINAAQTMITKWDNALGSLTKAFGTLPESSHTEITTWLSSQAKKLQGLVTNYENVDATQKTNIRNTYKVLSHINEALNHIHSVKKYKVNARLDTIHDGIISAEAQQYL